MHVAPLSEKKRSTGSANICWLLSLVWFLVLPVLAQVAPTGTISGTVKDPAGATIPNANVTVTRVESNTQRTSVTDENGAFNLPALPVGHYNVSVAATGFKTDTDKGITLDIDQEAVVNFTMTLGQVDEQVVVSAESEQARVDTTSSSIGHVVDNTQIAELPLNGRNFIDLTILQTGVTQFQNNQAGSAGLYGEFFSANGAPIRSNMYLLDGAIMGNVQGATASSISGESLGLDGISEYKLITNSYSAEYGLVMGSQTAIVTKGGTNQFHGDAFEYLRNSVLNARNYFDELYSLSPSVPGGGRRIAPFERNQFGGTLGGPIKKNKTFFFGTYEGFREVDDDDPSVGITPTIPAACHQPVVNGVETVTSACDSALTGTATENVNPVIQPILGLWPLPNVQPGNEYAYLNVTRINEDYAQGRVDQTFSSKDTGFARYTFDRTTELIPRIFQIFDTGLYEKQQYFTLGENHVFSPTLLNSARFSFSRSHITDGTPSSSNPYTSMLTGPQYSCVTGQPICSFNVTSIANFSDTGADSILQTQGIFSMGDDMFLTKGKHALKFGVLVNHFDQYADLAHGQKGMTAFASLQSFLLGKYRNYTVYEPGYNGLKDMLFFTAGGYVQDEYRIRPRVTLNLGFRYEFNSTPNEKNGRQSYFLNPPYSQTVTTGPMLNDPTYRDFSPRVGFAWDVFGDGKTSLRGGAAILYDIANLGAIFGLAGEGTPPYSISYTVTPTMKFASLTNPTVQAYPTLVLPLPVPVFTGSLSGTAPTAIEHNYKSPHTFDYNMAIERQLPFKTVLSVAYAGSRGLNLWQPADEVNPYCPTTYKSIPQGCAGITNQVGGALPTWQTMSATTSPCGATQCRLNPFYSNFSLFETRGVSWYNSLQVNLTKSVSHGLQFQAAYTYSKLLDDTEGIANTDTSGATTDTVEDPLDPIVDYGPGDFDIRHNFHFNSVYHLPNYAHGNITGKLINGWWTGNIINIHTGTPFSPLESSDREQSGIATGGGGLERVSVVTSANLATIQAQAAAAGYTTCPAGSTTSTCVPYNPVVYDHKHVYDGAKNASEWFNPNMFALAPVGTIGTVGRNILTEPGLSEWDFSLNKDTRVARLGEAGMIQFRAEFFNVLNHTNFGPVHVGGLFSGTATDAVERPNFNGINATATPGRQIQFSLKALF
jgi:hypothetical protein